MTVEEAIEALETSPQGLSGEEARRRLVEFGPNELIEEERKSPITLFLEQFKSFLIIILLVALAISAILGEYVDVFVILAVVIASATLGFAQEYRAEKALEALKRLTAPTAKVIRDGREVEIAARELVPGDIVLLGVGDRVPADARLIEEMNLQTDESLLTGESTPVVKTAEALPSGIAVPEMKNIVFTATTITYGRGKAVVTSTGMGTEVGKVADIIQSAEEEETPLEVKVGQVGRWVGVVCLMVSAVVSLLGILRGHEILEMFLWGVSLAVAVVPEALPAVVTGALALGVRRMASQNAIVRRLPAVETLGSVTVICSDKTGTLTKGEMTVRRAYTNGPTFEVGGVGYEPVGSFSVEGRAIDPREEHLQLLSKVATLCNDACLEAEGGVWRVRGDTTEGALVVAAAKAGVRQDVVRSLFPRVGEIAFSSERKLMTTIHRTPEGGLIACVKGAPEVVLRRCTHHLRDGSVETLTVHEEEGVLKMTERMAADALRVIGIAYRELPEAPPTFTEKDTEKELIFVGLMGMIDPPRQEVMEAIKLCEQAGIKVVMITGDHKLTAVAVAKELSLLRDGGLVLTGSELDLIGDDELERMVEDVRVYARVLPAHKVRIVDALKKRGHIVAMTGDGINDAPALKRADIGVAMGITGTDVTKEASDMVLADDNFATIVAAVEEGRKIYDNIKKYLTYTLAGNMDEVFTVLLIFILGFPILPLTASQLLFVNLITDGFPAIALSVDPAAPDTMRRRPRDPKERIFTRRVLSLIFGTALTFTAITMWLLNAYVQAGVELVRLQTTLMTMDVMSETYNTFNCRSEKESMFKMSFTSNIFILLAIPTTVLIQLAVIYIPPLNGLFHTAPMGPIELAMSFILPAAVIVVVEAGKFVWRRRHPDTIT